MECREKVRSSYVISERPLFLEAEATSDVAAGLHLSALGSFTHRPTGSAVKSERRRDL